MSGSVAIVACDAGVCPACGSARIAVVVSEPALFRHGGYGATRRTTVRVCSECPSSHVAEVAEVRPQT